MIPQAMHDTPYTVVVRAVDGDGDVENITVRIYVLPTQEPPTIDRVYVEGRFHRTHRRSLIRGQGSYRDESL